MPRIYSKRFVAFPRPQTAKLFRVLRAVLKIVIRGRIIAITKIYDAHDVPCNICGEFVISPCGYYFHVVAGYVVSTRYAKQ